MIRSGFQTSTSPYGSDQFNSKGPFGFSNPLSDSGSSGSIAGGALNKGNYANRIKSFPSYTSTFARPPMMSPMSVDRGSGTSYTNFKTSTPGMVRSPAAIDRASAGRNPYQPTTGNLSRGPMTPSPGSRMPKTADTYSDSFSRRFTSVNGTSLMKDRMWGGKFMPGGQGTWSDQASFQSAQQKVSKAFAKPSGTADTMEYMKTPKVMKIASTPPTSTRTGSADTMSRTATPVQTTRNVR